LHRLAVIYLEHQKSKLIELLLIIDFSFDLLKYISFLSLKSYREAFNSYLSVEIKTSWIQNLKNSDQNRRITKQSKLMEIKFQI